ncbi:MAG: hypothetical protein IT319_00965 [Anaerolineae bacterium]|nr:hypothetical protein [Anaerolineae bacterium]
MPRPLVLRLLLCLFIWGAGCTAQPDDGVPTRTTNPIVTLAQAQQVDAPALAASENGLIAAWVGSDTRGVHQDARRVTAGSLGDAVTLPLPPTHPYAQQLYPGSGSVHLLWIDADETNQTRLFSALLTPSLSVERGPVAVSDALALDYAAASDGSGGLWTAWSGGLLGELALSVRRIDDAGRPLIDTTIIAAPAEHPALLRTESGEIWLFWLGNGQLMRQRLDPTADTPQALTSAVSLGSGDQLIDVRAGLDRSAAYIFWNITRADGTSETWMTAGALNASAWRQPRRLQIDTGQPGASFGLRWLVPLAVTGDTLTTAAESDAGLNIVQFSAGTIVGYRTVVPGARLIGLPSLAADATGARYLAWAAPGETSAALQLMTLSD